MNSPSLIPAGTSKYSSTVVFTTPFPLHGPHGYQINPPAPLHFSQIHQIPRFESLKPLPPHSEHCEGVVPFSDQDPLHALQVTSFSTETFDLPPFTISMKSISAVTFTSFPFVSSFLVYFRPYLSKLKKESNSSCISSS